MKKLLVSFGVVVLGIMLWSAPASAKLDCAALDGDWDGSMKGLLNGATIMTLKKCRMNWQLPDRRTNICRLREKK